MDDNIIPISELRKHLSDVTKWVEKERKPMYLTKNGRGRFVMLDMQSYRELTARAGKGESARNIQASPKTEASKPQAGFVAAPKTAPRPERVHARENLSSNMKEEEDRILKELGLL